MTKFTTSNDILMKKIFVLSIFTFQLSLVIFAQPDRWQQRVKYTMNVDMNVQTNQFTGKQKLEYTNNSPDTLTKVFYHLYFNAFQPGSMMDTRSRRQGAVNGGGGRPDWDSRVKDRIVNLKPDEIGYQKIISLKMNGRPQVYTVFLQDQKLRLIWNLKHRYPCRFVVVAEITPLQKSVIL